MLERAWRGAMPLLRLSPALVQLFEHDARRCCRMGVGLRRAMAADAAASSSPQQQQHQPAPNNHPNNPTRAIPCAPPPTLHPITRRPIKAAVALSGGVDSAVAALRAKEHFGRENVFCVWARTWDAGDEEGSGAGGSGTAPNCYGGSCGGGGAADANAAADAASPSSTPPPPPVTPSACEAEADLRSAQRVASSLGLPLIEADLRTAYWNRVFDGFLAEAAGGSATPNPDLGCNSAVKFGALLDFVRGVVRRQGQGGGDGHDEVVLVTGHYARVGVAVVQEGEGALASSSLPPPHPLASSPSSSSARLLRGLDRRKDQSYFLSTLTSEQLSHSWFPIGQAASKADVRAVAQQRAEEEEEAGNESAAAFAAVAARRSSAGICFVGRRRRFADFLEGYLDPVPGRFVCCETGADLGACANLLAVTHGQRAPLAGGAMMMAAALRGGNETTTPDNNNNKALNPRWYVVAKDMERRVAHVAAGRGHPALRSRAVLLEAPRWVAGRGGESGREADDNASSPLPFTPGSLLQYKARYRQEAAGWCRVRHATPQEAVERDGGGAGGTGGARFRASRFFQRRRESCVSSRQTQPTRLLLVAELAEPAHAPTPGQAFVMYRGDECLGSATIAAPGRTVFEEEEDRGLRGAAAL